MNFYAFSLKVPKDWNLLFPGNSLSLILKEKARGKIVVWSVNEKPKSKTIGGGVVSLSGYEKSAQTKVCNRVADVAL